MTWLLLFALTALAVLWPLLPAFIEWYRPTDVMPLQIDTLDTLDPAYLARSFATHLATVLDLGQTQLGCSVIAQAPSHGDWPLAAQERCTATSRRVWQTSGDACLPAGVRFLAEVSAHGTLRTAVDGVYRALWAGHHLQLAAHSTVLRWAHGARVDVGRGCRLAGRVSADERITVRSHTAFTLLHAPTVRFLPVPAGKPTVAPPHLSWIGLPQAVRWDAAAARGTCDESLDVGAHCAWRGDLVCCGTLSLGPGCSAHGSVKAHGDLRVAAGSNITGSVVAAGRITLGAGCRVRGSVLSENAIALGSGCVIGAPGQPATVAAPRIKVAPGVVVHGTLWAGKRGRTQGPAAVQNVLDPGARELPGEPARKVRA